MSNLDYSTAARLLRADFNTGKLYWLPRTPEMLVNGKLTAEVACRAWNSRFSGSEALTADCGGYRHGLIFGSKYKAHRVLWLLHTGDWPDGEIDHINGDPSDNRIVNLRCVSRSENIKNTKVRSNNTSGVMGVHWSKASGKWNARIVAGGKHRHLGFFDDLADAISARKVAEAENGYHQNHGRSLAASHLDR